MSFSKPFPWSNYPSETESLAKANSDDYPAPRQRRGRGRPVGTTLDDESRSVYHLKRLITQAKRYQSSGDDEAAHRMEGQIARFANSLPRNVVERIADEVGGIHHLYPSSQSHIAPMWTLPETTYSHPAVRPEGYVPSQASTQEWVPQERGGSFRTRYTTDPDELSRGYHKESDDLSKSTIRGSRAWWIKQQVGQRKTLESSGKKTRSERLKAKIANTAKDLPEQDVMQAAEELGGLHEIFPSGTLHLAPDWALPHLTQHLERHSQVHPEGYEPPQPATRVWVAQGRGGGYRTRYTTDTDEFSRSYDGIVVSKPFPWARHLVELDVLSKSDRIKKEK